MLHRASTTASALPPRSATCCTIARRSRRCKSGIPREENSPSHGTGLHGVCPAVAAAEKNREREGRLCIIEALECTLIYSQLRLLKTQYNWTTGFVKSSDCISLRHEVLVTLTDKESPPLGFGQGFAGAGRIQCLGTRGTKGGRHTLRSQVTGAQWSFSFAYKPWPVIHCMYYGRRATTA